MAKNTKLTLTINLVLFLIILLVHLIRIITGTTAQFGTWIVPIWASWIGIIIASLMVYLNYKSL